MKILLTTLMVLIASALMAQQEYAVARIPQNLIEDADRVVRKEESYFEILSVSKSRLHVKKVITYLNDNNKPQESLVVHYNSFIKLGKLNAIIYDKTGRVERRVSKIDFVDVSAINGFSLYEDNRVKVYQSNYSNYPYTIELNYTQTFEDFIFYPVWRPQDLGNTSVQFSEFKVNYPVEHQIRIKEYNNSMLRKNIIDEQGDREIRWRLENSPVTKVEQNTIYSFDHLPRVRLAPNDFIMGGIEGDLSTWNGFGKWYHTLNLGRDQLTTEGQASIRKMVQGINNPKHKIEKVYDHLQNTSRYVSIQIGIGGWQTFPAQTTEEYGYGDCKALTTYTKAMLNAADINSYYALVQAGHNADPVDEDFPSANFNHVILCVPLEEDTIWLECTSQKLPFGYLGSFTSNRNVLVVNGESSALARTPTLTADQNVQKTQAKLIVNDDGSISSNISMVFEGFQYEYRGINRVIDKSTSVQKTWINKNLIPGQNLLSYEMTEIRGPQPAIQLRLETKLENGLTNAGSMGILNLDIMNHSKRIPDFEDERRSDFVIKYATREVDTIEFTVPKKFQYFKIPKVNKIRNEFGSYDSQVKIIDERRILYIRSFELRAGTYPSNLYEKYTNFRKSVSDMDDLKILLKTRT